MKNWDDDKNARAIQNIFSPPLPNLSLNWEKFLSQEKETELKLRKGIVAAALESVSVA